MRFLARLPLFVVIALLSACTAFAQEIDAKSSSISAGREAAKSDRSFSRIHITDDLLRSPEGQEALRNFIDARKSGRLTLGKGAAALDTIGQQKDFNVQTSLLDQQNKEWSVLNFTLRATNSVANVWVETALDGTFSQDRMDELEAFILNATPDESFRSDRGIIENDNNIFGTPPNYDGDGAVDILLHDIDEGEDQGCCVLGYVTGVDINPSAGSGQGNQADVLYVDLPDGLRNGGVVSMAGTIAHEYQHLIHLAYQDSPEWTFINEGLSEWAEVMNGFFLRTINYLQNTAEHNTELLDFRTNESVEVRDKDYQRSGLFTTYIADRIGWEATGSIVRATLPNSSVYAAGPTGYNVVLQNDDLTLVDIVADFHTANFVNDRSIGDRFGYSLLQRQDFVVTPSTSIDGTSQTSATTTPSLNGGAVHYITWNNVADLLLDVDATIIEGDPTEMSRYNLFAEPAEGSAQVIEIGNSVTDYELAGEYRQVTLIISNVAVSYDLPVNYSVASSWTSGQGSFAEETIFYDDGQLSGTVYYDMPATTRQATKFDVPSGGRLEQVFVAPVWDNQLQEAGLPSGLPRDFTLYIWEDDGSGLPGSELFSLVQTESPTTSHVGQEGLIFLAIDLSDEDALQGGLPQTIYVGIGNAGTDQNILSLATSVTTETEDKSFLYYPFDGTGSPNSWAPYSTVTASGESILEGTVLPVRAQFLVPTAEEDEVELPTEISLAQNYPNPFNPSTRIEYSLPRATHVRLVVYDVLGKEIATIVDGVRSAGDHASRVNAAGWSSGVYFYTLETEGRTETRQMIVLK